MFEYKLSILTPTYNRGYILGTLYESLCRQTSKAFEWIIVDDGSSDNTEALVKAWAVDSPFQIVYIKQENGGKHRALNKGIPAASYEYIYVIDSDDYLVDHAVQKIYGWIGIIDGKHGYAGISGLRGTPDGKIIGQYPDEKPYVDATSLEREKCKLIGDKAEVIKKEILLLYPFPEFENEKFLAENAVWYRISADGYKLRWFGDIICICEYLQDGLTKNSNSDRIRENFEGYTYVERLNIKLKEFPHNFLAIGRYYYIAKKIGLTNQEIKKRLEISSVMFNLGKAFGIARIILKKIKAALTITRRGEAID
jgi:glycosyltransferase involved in cell wall biosynthesis